VAEGVEGEGAVEAGALLPDLERSPKLAGREAVADAAHEHRRVGVEGLPLLPLPGVELVELGPDVVVES
jgi:hypothetical protein